MKSFIISLCLLLFFVILTTVNRLAVGSIFDNVLDSLDVLPESTGNYIPDRAKQESEALFDYWCSKRRFLSLTINTAELRDCETALGNLAEFSDSDTGADYNAALSEAKVRVNVLADRESLSLFNIL